MAHKNNNLGLKNISYSTFVGYLDLCICKLVSARPVSLIQLLVFIQVTVQLVLDLRAENVQARVAQEVLHRQSIREL